MPLKYSHVKKRSASGLMKKTTNNGHGARDGHQRQSISSHVDRSITQAMAAVSQLERAIARIFLKRYEHDIARLFSTHLFSVALVHLPTLAMRCISIGGPGWVAYNADCEEIKDFFRLAISMDMRQAGERVATKSVLWSYTALRDFALSNNVHVCQRRGLHSLRLLPHYPALKAHLDQLESMPTPTFSKPPHLGPLTEGLDALEEACQLKYGDQVTSKSHGASDWDDNWRLKVRLGYERLCQTLWRVAREFDVRGYGMVLREKLTAKWCDCGCSTDHLGEVCEKTVREDEESSGIRPGKQREWDGRGSGIYGWETEEEEDIWEMDLDFGSSDSDEEDACSNSEMTIGEMMEWRYFAAEKEKELGNAAFRQGDYNRAVKHYEVAHDMEPEMPHYQLNIAAAQLKLNNWMEAEIACTRALGQHRSGKGYYRRAKARKMMGNTEEATKDLRAVLKLQPCNTEANAELWSLIPPEPTVSASSSSYATSSSLNNASLRPLALSNYSHLRVPKSKFKQPPFSRTKGDDRKIKIVLLPTTVELASSRSPCGNRAKAKRKAEGTDVKTETFAVPNWEKYVIRQVAD
ncbi:hypothetical protein SERLA73DRAFT_182385 [Serpula lacrymans var. lacrymans S7.3]|uniref:Uncharacterized protein n=2 Tax=Serpula lacrymans var. lacrymans TaxID=341189 RepID=F8PX34_SERL3|nr:uncharacterized protein SERLADRAFT_469006 [Serpula lacrymans var. lacrymans S7.9]EGN99413.1 hypothetical protein SERLA73DRAFT_182385 [Serpula lacrymans var. lacrymans S7.3]EGO24976.1 hypothetical protein SERLADRAFT_469006 [Serpula lacrymans var. lacrymans S7.9]